MNSPEKVAKFTVKLFYFIAIAYTSINLGGPYYDVPSIAFPLIFLSTVFILFFRLFKLSLNQKTKVALVFLMPLIVANGLMSIEVFNSFVYWGLWLMFTVGLLKIVRVIGQKEIEYILKHIPYILLLASIILYIMLIPYLQYSIPTKNSLGLISGGSLIAAMSINDMRYRWGAILISFTILFQSDSRSSLVFALGILFLYILLGMNKKTFPLLVLVIVGFIGSFGYLYNLLEQKMLKKEQYATNLQEAVTSAQKERTDLLIIGWELFKERPLIGFGLKSKYYEGRINAGGGKDIHVHNGYLGTLIETGVLISFLVLFYVLTLFSKIIKAILFISKRSEKIWIFFVSFGLIRAYGENYLIFNIGNIFSILFLFLGLVIVFERRISLVH